MCQTPSVENLPRCRREHAMSLCSNEGELRKLPRQRLSRGPSHPFFALSVSLNSFLQSLFYLTAWIEFICLQLWLLTVGPFRLYIRYIEHSLSRYLSTGTYRRMHSFYNTSNNPPHALSYPNDRTPTRPSRLAPNSNH
jgi:hypothetical protein